MPGTSRVSSACTRSSRFANEPERAPPLNSPSSSGKQPSAVPTEDPLERRVREHFVALGLGRGPLRVLVAFSGGCDSLVLLYLLRFRPPVSRLEVCAAHLDHRMRAGSAGDAAWVRGLCAAWGVPLQTDQLPVSPTSEADARRERYDFLRAAAARAGATLIATAHHADDQAETVLFRAVRGTGLRGLGGIPALHGGIVRPLLPLWRHELEGYARQSGLRWRTDESNLGLGPARNRVRRDLLPRIERSVASSARRNLVTLAALASEAEGALDRLAREAEGALVEWEEGVPSLARERLRAYDPAIASRVLRNLLRPFGVVLGRTGTRRALQFITDAHSGRQMPLSGTLRVELEFDRAVLRRSAAPLPEQTLEIGTASSEGRAEVRLGGQVYHVAFGPGPSPAVADAVPDDWTLRSSTASLAFPLHVRGWRDGDRVRLARGARSLKRFFHEQRVPRERRRQLPLLVDATGAVVWVAGINAGVGSTPPAAGESFIVKVLHD